MINSTNRFKIKLNTNSTCQNYTGIVASIPTGGTKLSNFKSAAIYAKVKHSKNQIMQENQGKSGIYLFRNSINGQIYIGSSINLKEDSENILILIIYKKIIVWLFAELS
jgi:hypothetical protein